MYQLTELPTTWSRQRVIGIVSFNETREKNWCQLLRWTEAEGQVRFFHDTVLIGFFTERTTTQRCGPHVIRSHPIPGGTLQLR